MKSNPVILDKIIKQYSQLKNKSFAGVDKDMVEILELLNVSQPHVCTQFSCSGHFNNSSKIYTTKRLHVIMLFSDEGFEWIINLYDRIIRKLLNEDNLSTLDKCEVEFSHNDIIKFRNLKQYYPYSHTLELQPYGGQGFYRCFINIGIPTIFHKQYALEHLKEALNEFNNETVY